MRFIGLIIYLNVFVILVQAQGLPETAFDIQEVQANSNERAVIDGVLEALKKGGAESLQEAKFHFVLNHLYPLLSRDSSRYYGQKVDEYWNDNSVDVSNADFFGQYLLMKSTRSTRVTERDRRFLDSASIYLKNPTDKLYLEMSRWKALNPLSERAEYIFSMEELLKRELPDNIRGAVDILHSRYLINNFYGDSAMKILERVELLELSVQWELAYRNMLVSQLIVKSKLKEARRNLVMMGSVMNKQVEKNTLATIYYGSLDEFFRATQQYDSAAFYVLKSVTLLKSFGLEMATYPFYGRLRDIYLAQDDFVNAEKSADEALRLSPAQNKIITVRNANQLLDALLISYNDRLTQTEQNRLIEKMKETLARQEEAIVQTNSPDALSNFNLLKARYLTIIGQHRLAEVILNQESDERYAIKRSLFQAQLYLAQGKYNQAISVSSSLLEEDELRERKRVTAHEVLMEAYIGMSRPREALQQLDFIKSLNENQVKVKTNFLLEEFEVKQELEIQKALNQSLEEDQQIKSVLINRQRLIIAIVLLSIVIISLFLLRLRALNKRNHLLLRKLEDEGEELQQTNSELIETVSELQHSQSSHQDVLDKLSAHLNKMFNALRGLQSYIPEVGKLNGEQARYFNRMTDVVKHEARLLDELISLNTVLENHEIDIRRVSISDVLKGLQTQVQKSLQVNEVRLDVDTPEGLIFLTDQELLEMSLVCLVQYALQQELLGNVITLKLEAENGLNINFQFKGKARDEGINHGRSDYLTKLSQLKDLMDGDLQYLKKGDFHEIQLKLNLLEIKTTEDKGIEIDQLEIDRIYNRVMEYLIDNGGVSDSELSLASLATALSLPSRKVSYVINRREKTNFSKFLSKLRIDQVCGLLDKGKHSHLNLAGIGYEAGFNSKSTFYASFKDFMGCTPKEYINSLVHKTSY